MTIIMTMVAPLTIQAGQFKAKCLELMDRVAASGEPIVITKRGKPVVMLTPVRDPTKGVPGFFKGKMTIIGDILGPLELDWGPAEPEIRPSRQRRRR